MTTVSSLERNDALTLNKLSAELVRRQQTKHDMVVDTRRIGLHVDEGQNDVFMSIDGTDEIAPVDGWKINEHAHSQLAGNLQIPKKYWDRMRTAAPDLLVTNAQHWFINDPKDRMVRCLDGKVRAFLSSSYRRLDDYDLMTSLLPVFDSIPGLTFQVASLTDTRLHIRALLPGLEREVQVGDAVQAGVEIRNSEVGAGALTVSPFVWRLVCKNGMVMPVATRRYHVGRRIDVEDENILLYRQETLNADDEAYFMKVADIVRSVFDESRFEAIVRQLQAAAEVPIASTPVKATKILAQRHGLNEGEEQDVLAHLAAGGDLTHWGLANAITATAKDAESWDRLAELEALGGEIATTTEVFA